MVNNALVKLEPTMVRNTTEFVVVITIDGTNVGCEVSVGEVMVVSIVGGIVAT